MGQHHGKAVCVSSPALGGTFERRRQKDLELSHPGPRARTGAPQGMKRKPESAVLAQDKDAVRPGPGDTLCPLIHRLL